MQGRLESTACRALPGMSGPDLQRELMLRRKMIPIVFITAHGGESVRPRLLEQGAVECLLKPFSDTVLREALNAHLEQVGLIARGV